MTAPSPPLLRLFDRTQTFSETALLLSESTSPKNHFQLLISLHDFVTSTAPNDTDALHARMKAEWCLWEAYSKWDLGLNPFLGHFVQVWELGGDSPDILTVVII